MLCDLRGRLLCKNGGNRFCGTPDKTGHLFLGPGAPNRVAQWSFVDPELLDLFHKMDSSLRGKFQNSSLSSHEKSESL